MANEKAVYDATLQACEDADVKGTVRLIHAMYKKSDDTEQCARLEMQGNRGIDVCLKLAAAYVRATIPGKYNSSNLFTSNATVFETLADAIGRARGDWTPAALGNYMRVGMVAIAQMYADWKMEERRGEVLKEYIADRLLGEKPYPRMVWGDGDVGEWLMSHGDENVALSCKTVHLGQWTAPSHRWIRDIVGGMLLQFHEEDFFGRGRLQPWKQGLQLLQEYPELTQHKDTDRLHRYHFEHFWSIVLRRVGTEKGWNKRDDDTAAYLLTKNVPVIIEQMHPHVPWHVQNILNKETVKRLVKEAPPMPPEYRPRLLPEKQIMTKMHASWLQAGFTSVSLEQVRQLADKQGLEAMAAALRDVGLQELVHRDGVTYELGTVLHRGQVAKYRPK